MPRNRRKCPAWVKEIIPKILGPDERVFAGDLMHRVWLHDKRFRGREFHECSGELKDCVKHARYEGLIVITTGTRCLTESTQIALKGNKPDLITGPSQYCLPVLKEHGKPMRISEIADAAKKKYDLPGRVSIISTTVGAYLRSDQVRDEGVIVRDSKTKKWSLSEWASE